MTGKYIATTAIIDIKRIMIMATGAGISIIVVSMGIYMIVQTSKEIKKYRGNKEQG